MQIHSFSWPPKSFLEPWEPHPLCLVLYPTVVGLGCTWPEAPLGPREDPAEQRPDDRRLVSQLRAPQIPPHGPAAPPAAQAQVQCVCDQMSGDTERGSFLHHCFDLDSLPAQGPGEAPSPSAASALISVYTFLFGPLQEESATEFILLH